MPQSVSEMVEQAGEAVITAYRDGINRQSVRLNVEAVCPTQRQNEAGMDVLLEDCMPMLEKFTKSLGLPGGAPLRDVRMSAIDATGSSSGDVGTLFYRMSEEAAQDVAVCFLASRIWAVEESTEQFLDGMGKRLVVLVNSEDAASNFKVEMRGKEFTLAGGFDGIELLRNFVEKFREETYYYRARVSNGWYTIIFRAYPHPWQAYVADLNGQPQLLGESEAKPSGDLVKEWSDAYEVANGISELDKQQALRG